MKCATWAQLYLMVKRLTKGTVCECLGYFRSMCVEYECCVCADYIEDDIPTQAFSSIFINMGVSSVQGSIGMVN